MSFLKRLLGSTPRATPAPEATPLVLRRPDLGNQAHADGPAMWQPRDLTYWPERSAHVIKRLRNDWHQNPERAKWPDATELMNRLAGPPDEVIRQLPAAARDAIALCDNANVTRLQLAEKLGQDPSLVQGLLRQANGAFYGGGLKPVIRVDAAIDRVGLSATRAIVLASCVDGLLSKPGGAYDMMLASVWTHMVNTGPFARLVAPTFGADPEEAFAVALLHDVGKLVIFDSISTLRVAKRAAVHLPEAWLSSVIDHLHEPLGALAAQRWGLGASAADTIGSHHRRERPATIHPLAESLFVAERVEHAVRKGQRFDFAGVWGLGLLNGDITALRGCLGRHVRAAA
ncbi:MAG: HDOD domain-containing protein [Phycisphaerae bacterium]|nr:HDOD domain-containing protein [Gemmatimonadaceae bacterium]